MIWLIHKDVLRQLRDQRRTAELSAEEQRAHEQRVAARDNGPRSLRLAGDVAEIRVEGVLTKAPDFWAWLLGIGNTTYPDMIEAMRIAKSDPAVKSVRLFVDSPGGSADGLFDTIAALQDLRASKPVSVVAANAYSAAYGLAAVGGPIQATNAGSMFGSVGVATSYVLWDDVVDLTNTESPDKRPDLSTESGRAVVVRELDAVFDLFSGAIATGRGTTQKDVIENFGRGASFVAGDAKRRGMIDSIAKPVLRAVAPAAAASAVEENESNVSADGGSRKATTMAMTLEELRAQHPSVYLEAVEVGVAQGTAQERKRVNAHLKIGKAVGAMDTAMKAIESGVSSQDEEIQAEYFVARSNLSDRNTRQAESDAAGQVVEGADPTGGKDAATPDVGDKIVAALKAQGGI